ncbi:hypothetical protein MSG28_001946 [Choristoneura fumiferana]|uniref:Uncharacterized protein n=1 Tax=Choristoneura fumiferana TaxID=7141 RepID=A0ACC0JTN0_CHOFU|nr:hypothetical protein MSG28_001946 [Choristoneura fumiferana]
MVGNRYISSLYFVLTTFSQNGAGDIMPKKQSEAALLAVLPSLSPSRSIRLTRVCVRVGLQQRARSSISTRNDSFTDLGLHDKHIRSRVLFVSVLQVLTTMVYMVYVGEFSNIIQYTSFRSFSYYSKYLELQEFLKNNRVSTTLVKLVNRYSVHLWREARGEQMPHFLIIAPRCLKLKVMSAAYLDELRKHPVFMKCEPDLLRQLVGHFRQYYYDEDMYVVKEGEITDSMYLVHTGKVEERSGCHSQTEISKIYTPGEYIGVGLVRDQPFPYSYRTLIKSQVLTLRLEDWEYLLEHFPASKAAINKYQTLNGDDGGNSDRYDNRGSKSPSHGSYGPGGPSDRTSTSPPSRGSQVQFLRGSPKGSIGGTSRGLVGSLDRSLSPTSASSSPKSSTRRTNSIPDSSQQPSTINESSSTLLFEQLRQAAISIPDDQTLPDTGSSKSNVSIRSVEGYLSDKYNMSENYPVVPFTSKPSVNENEVSSNLALHPLSRGIHVRYQDNNDERTQDTNNIVTDHRDAATDEQPTYTIAEISPKLGETTVHELDDKGRTTSRTSLVSENLKREYLALEHVTFEESSDASQALSVEQKASSPQKEITEHKSKDENDQTPTDSRKVKQTTFDRRVSEVYIPLDNVSKSPSLKSVTEKILASLDSDVIAQDTPLSRQTSDISKSSNSSVASNRSDKPSSSKKQKKKKKKKH